MPPVPTRIETYVGLETPVEFLQPHHIPWFPSALHLDGDDSLTSLENEVHFEWRMPPVMQTYVGTSAVEQVRADSTLEEAAPVCPVGPRLFERVTRSGGHQRRIEDIELRYGGPASNGVDSPISEVR